MVRVKWNSGSQKLNVGVEGDPMNSAWRTGELECLGAPRDVVREEEVRTKVLTMYGMG